MQLTSDQGAEMQKLMIINIILTCLVLRFEKPTLFERGTGTPCEKSNENCGHGKVLLSEPKSQKVNTCDCHTI